MVVFTVLGGLALFLLGMGIMTDGLRQALGTRLRQILGRVARSRRSGVGWGTVFGFLVHSSAATVMVVAFVNAGLLTFLEAIPTIMGANIGTTLSMQLISLEISHYAYLAIAVGFAVKLFSPVGRTRHIGMAIIGFGMIFLGMNIMGDAIRPYRVELQPYLAVSDATTVRGMVLGIGMATLVTLVIQSSGATIAMCFTLASSGVFEGLHQVYPIVLGAHMGTCITALLGSIGTNIEARRCAYAHLGFNVAGTVLAVLLVQPMLAVVQWTSDDLVRQTANLHMGVMLLATCVLLPGTAWFAAAIRRLSPSEEKVPEPSALDPELLSRPEDALAAAIRELQRSARLLKESFRLQGELLLLLPGRKVMARLHANEQAVNDIKVAMRDFLNRLAYRYLSRRQAILAQHLDRCMVEIERIGDHILAMAQLSVKRRTNRDAIFSPAAFDRLFNCYEMASKILQLVIQSLEPRTARGSGKAIEVAEAILCEREAYRALSYATRQAFLAGLEEKTETPLSGIYYDRYMSSIDRIVKHTKMIALVEQQPDFWIKNKKLGRAAASATAEGNHALVDSDEYLIRLQAEDTV